MIQWQGAGYKNLDGKNTLKGVEISFSKELFENTLLSLNYSTLSAKDKDGKDLTRRADKTFKASIDYYGVDKLHLNLTANYVGERWDDSAKTKQTGRYTVINTAINYQVTPSTLVYLKVDNLTDKYYQTVDGYATSPRAYYAGVKYKFWKHCFLYSYWAYKFLVMIE